MRVGSIAGRPLSSQYRFLQFRANLAQAWEYLLAEHAIQAALLEQAGRYETDTVEARLLSFPR